MTLHGTQGYDPQSIRQEVARGARFVIYPFCVSVVVMTFKRNSGVYFVKPGESRLLKGAPFSLLTLLAGWWGFPWGPIYSIQALVNNFTGGIDVTSEVLATIPGASEAHTVLPPEHASKNPSTGKKVAIGAAVVGSLAAIAVVSVCVYKKMHLPVYLISGDSRPYTVAVDGRSYTLRNGHAVEVECTEGDIVVTGDGKSATAEHRYHLSAPFFDHLFGSKVAVINPDGVGIFVEDRTAYFVGTPPAKDPETEGYTLFANQGAWLLDARDFLFCDFPKHVSMPSGAGRVVKTRLTSAPDLSLAVRARLVSEKFGYDGLKTFLNRAAASGEEDFVVLAAAEQQLKPADYRAFLERGCRETPVRVEWHRFYQTYTAVTHPDVDLEAEYTRLWKAHPEEGAYAYLLSRVIEGYSRPRELARQALEAKRPCGYAHVSKAYYALSDGDFATACSECRLAKAAGVAADVVGPNEREARLGMRDYAGLLKETGRADTGVAKLTEVISRISYRLLAGGKVSVAENMAKAYLAQLDARHGFKTAQERAQAASYLEAVIAYGSGDESRFAGEMAKIGSPALEIEAAVARHDDVAAARLLAKEKAVDAQPYFLCYILAMESGRPDAADGYFKTAVGLLATGPYRLRKLADALASGKEPGAEALLRADMFPTEKRTFLTAMAYRYPHDRDALAGKAELLNVDPAFPCQTIRRATEQLTTHS